MHRHILAVVKDSGERYVFLFDRESYDAFLQQLWIFAADPELSFDWGNAHFLKERAKEILKGSPNG